MREYVGTINLRLQIIGVFFVVITAVLFWKMYTLQIEKHDHYLYLAQGQQRFEKTEMASRGKILVHDSAIDPKSYYPMAFDVKKFAVWVIPRQVKDKQKTADKLAPFLSIESSVLYEKINNDKLYIPPIKRGLTLAEARELTDKNLAGVITLPEYSRYYPEGTMASHILGFVNAESSGKYGFEGHYDNELRGKEGNVVGEKDTLGRVISLLEQKDPENGTSYVLTIDRSVQYYVEKKLAAALEEYKAESGTVVVMDVKTGGIVAMASNPMYDPNNYREQAKADPGLFMNPAISSLYEPGSIFKTITMAAALDQGVVTPTTESIFDWRVIVDGYEIKTAERKAFGKENMSQVLQNSDNVAMVWLAKKMSNETIYEYLDDFNFLDKTGVDLDGEVSGYTYALKNWREVTRATISFGQGIAVTPIQMVAAYAAIANGGTYIRPHIVDKIVFADGREQEVEKTLGKQVIKESVAKEVGEMLYSVVENGHSKRAKVPGFKIGAKTGTAQIPKKEGGYEESEDNLGIFIHSLAGFAPVDEPRFAMLVKLDRPKSALYAESTAAPLFGDIASFLLNYYYRVQPTGAKP